MTSPINSFQDILDALEQSPALRDQLRRHILTEELLQLPTQFLLLRADVGELKSGQARLEAGQARLETRMDRLEGRFGNVECHQYQQRAVNRILGRSRQLGIENPTIAYSQTGAAQQNFHDAMNAAVDTNLISQEQYDDLTEADLIVRGRNHRHAAFEISLGPDQNDIARAVRRANILEAATGETATPVIATNNPQPELLHAAQQQGAAVMNIPA